MKKYLIGALLIPMVAVAADNPLLSAPDTNTGKWAKELQAFKKPKLPSLNKYPQPFHSPNSYQYQMNDVCSACHTFAAHTKDKKYAPFYNAHGTFMSCNVCHFRKEGVTYRWAEIKNGKVMPLDKGDFYGLKYIESGDRTFLSGENSPAKIVPFLNGAPVEIPLRGNENLLKNSKAVSRMHNALSEKALTCEDCHKPDGKLDFGALGFSRQRVEDLENNEVVKGLEKYKVIHFPKFIW